MSSKKPKIQKSLLQYVKSKFNFYVYPVFFIIGTVIDRK